MPGEEEWGAAGVTAQTPAGALASPSFYAALNKEKR